MKPTKKIMFTLILFTTICFAQWQNRSNGILKDWAYAYTIDACDSLNAIFYINHYLYYTTNGGALWNTISYPQDIYGSINDISMIDKDHIWLAGSGILSLTNNFQIIRQQFYDPTKTKYFNYIKMFDLKNGIAMANSPSDTEPILLLKTTNGGLDWDIIDNNVIGAFSGDDWRRICFTNPDTGYFYRSGGIGQRLLKTTNGGIYWKELIPSFGDTHIDVVKFYSGTIGFASNYLKKSLYITKDSGTTWDTVRYFFLRRIFDIEFIPSRPAKIWLTNYDNLYFSSDTGSTWTTASVTDTVLRGADIVFTDENVGWLLCNNGNVYRTTNGGGLITSVNKKYESIQNEFRLEQNYPNPFNPSTTLNYTIPTFTPAISLRERVYQVHVTLKVYDVLGRVVATLVNEQKPPGNYNVMFYAKNLPSGVYFYTMNAGNYFESKKMILLR